MPSFGIFWEIESTCRATGAHLRRSCHLRSSRRLQFIQMTWNCDPILTECCKCKLPWTRSLKQQASTACALPEAFELSRHRTHVVSASQPTRRTHGRWWRALRAPALRRTDVRGNTAVNAWQEAPRSAFGDGSEPPSVSAPPSRTCVNVLLVLPGPNSHARLIKTLRALKCELWWCHAPEPQRRRRRHRALDENVAGPPERRQLRLKGCGVRAEDVEQRRRRVAVSLCRGRCCRFRESPGEAGSPAQPAGQTSHLQRAERPEKRALPAAPKLPVQRAGETESLGVHLPRVRVSLRERAGEFRAAHLLIVWPLSRQVLRILAQPDAAWFHNYWTSWLTVGPSRRNLWCPTYKWFQVPFFFFGFEN